MSESPRPTMRRRLLKRALRPLVEPLLARRAAELEAETRGLREQVHDLEDKVTRLVGELHRLTDHLTAAREDDTE